MPSVFDGDLQKMQSHKALDDSVSYSLVCGAHRIPLAEQLGRRIRLDFSGSIHCIHCGKATRKSFSQGYCFPCFQRLAQCDTCIMSPEKCHFPAGTCREPDWAETHCRVPHIVYLSNASGLKVGITRETQMPTRWIDQGAVQALPVFRVRERRLSGLIESALREFVSDRTQWQQMLKGDPVLLDLAESAKGLSERISARVGEIRQTEGDGSVEMLHLPETRLRYPVLTYPAKIKSLNPEKTPTLEGELLGIKGQYLILDSGCLNIRKHTGYHVTATLD